MITYSRVVVNKGTNWIVAKNPISISRKQTLDDNSINEIPKGTGLNFADLNGDGAQTLCCHGQQRRDGFTNQYCLKNDLNFKIGSVEISKSKPEEAFIGDIRSSGCNQKGDSCQLVYRAISAVSLGGAAFAYLRGAQLVDVNGDGLSDLVLSSTGKGGWKTYMALSKGNGQFDTPDSTVICQEVFPYYIAPNFGDFNADGLVDIILQKSDETGWQTLLAYGNGRGNFSLSQKTWQKIDTQNYSYSMLIPQKAVFCFDDFYFITNPVVLRLKNSSNNIQGLANRFPRMCGRITTN